jgi:competence protein ComEC
VKVPAAVPALAVLAGTACAAALDSRLLVPASLSLAAWVAALGAYRFHRPATFALAVGAACGAAAWALGGSAFREAETPPLRAALAGRLPSPSPVVVEGRLVTDAWPGANGVGLSLDVDAIPSEPGCGRPTDGRCRGGVRISVSGTLALERLDAWRAGRRVRVVASLREPGRFLDPGVPDSRLDLARRGTVLLGSVKSGALVDVLAHGTWLDERAADLRRFARGAIARHVGRWSTRSAAIVVAILIGDRVGLDEEVQRRLREAGTFHVIAISGGNIAILAALILTLLRAARVPTRPACWLAIAGLAAYSSLVGGGASVVRATLMAASYLVARQADHRSPPLNALAVACAVILVATPLAIADAGFALTFGATMGILVVSALVRERFLALPRWVRPPAALLAASVAAELALFPVAARAFSRVTFAGLLLNFAAIPLMSVAQIAGLATLSLARAAPALASVAGWLAHLGADGLVRSAALVDVAPWLTWRLPPPTAPALAAYYLGWCAWLWLRRARPRLARVALGVVAAASLWVLVEPITLLWPGVSGVLRVTVLDVGHADAVLVQLPDRRSLLVDAGGSVAGGSFDIGGRVVAPALWALGVRRLDALVISHGDPDHVGGAVSVMRDFRPREVWEGIPVPKSAPLAALRELAGRTRAVWRPCRTGQRFEFGSVTLMVWHPPEPDWERQKVRNDDSLVLELRYGEGALVLPGDLGSAVERRLAPSVPPAGLRLLKVPHHGSATSSSAEFLEALRPSVAVISAGTTTKVGADVLARYRAVGAAVFRTSEDGAVTITTDGHRLEVTTFTGNRLTMSVPSAVFRGPG